MDNLDLGRGNQDPRTYSFGWFLKGRRGMAEDTAGGGTGAGGGDGGGGGGNGGDKGGDGGDKGTDTLIDPATIDFSKIDWEKPSNWKGEFKDDPAMEKHKSPISLIKQVKELEQFVGMDKIPLPASPKEGATPKEIEKYNTQMGFVYGKLGRPEAADKYEVKAEFPEEAPLSDEAMGAIKNVAFKEGISNKQLNAVVSEYGKFLQGEVKKINDQKALDAETAVTAVKEKWGTAFDQRVAMANKAYLAFVKTDNLKKLFGGDKLGNDPEMMEFFFELGNVIGEDVIAGRTIPLTMTPDAAKVKIQELKIQQSKLKDGSPEYKLLQEQIDVAYKVAYPKLAAETAAKEGK